MSRTLTFVTNFTDEGGKRYKKGSQVDASDLSPKSLESVVKHKIVTEIVDPNALPEFDKITAAISEDPGLLDRLKTHYGKGLPGINEVVEAVSADSNLLQQIMDYYGLVNDPDSAAVVSKTKAAEKGK